MNHSVLYASQITCINDYDHSKQRMFDKFPSLSNGNVRAHHHMIDSLISVTHLHRFVNIKFTEGHTVILTICLRSFSRSKIY